MIQARKKVSRVSVKGVDGSNSYCRHRRECWWQRAVGQQDSDRVAIKKNIIKIKTTFKIQQRAKDTFPFPVILDYR